MTLTTGVLLVGGLLFLFLGWRWQHDDDNEKEVLVILKSLANLKHDVTRLEDRVKSLEIIISQRQPVQKVEIIGAQQLDNWERTLEEKQVNTTKTKDNRPKRGKKERISEAETHVLPDKYQRVLELAEQGLPPQEIAKDLVISQDAVVMVLRTHGKEANR